MAEWRFMLSFVLLVSVAAAWYISPPRLNTEWKEMAQLIVKTFDAPAASPADTIRWWLFEQALTEAYTMRHYTQTAQRMKSTKYNVFIAKQQQGRVMGVAEMGINGGAQGERRPTVGLICVESSFRKQGVAADLMAHCEHVASTVWNETVLYAEVEESNGAALRFFKSRGFQSTGNNQTVDVRRRRRLYKLPHLLLSKELPLIG